MPSHRLSREFLDFLRGFVVSSFRNDALNKAAYVCAKNRIAETEARSFCLRGAELCGLLAEEPEKTWDSFDHGFRDSVEAIRQRSPKVTDDRTAAPDLLSGLDCTDYGNAHRLVRRHGANLRYCYPFNAWLAWNDTH